MSEPSATPAREHPDVASALAMLEGALEARLAQRDLPSLSLGIVDDQTLLYARSFGARDLANGLPASPDTRYRIASISKTFTTTALLVLRDEGKLRLDDPVRDHLPWFSAPDRAEGDPAITVRHLVTHTSGLAREAAGLPYWMDEDFPTAGQLRADAHAVYPPEVRIKYSNLALALAGEVVAAVAAEPYAAYVQRRVLDPLGMRDTRLAPEADDAELAVGYAKRAQGARSVAPFSDVRALGPAAGMASTVRDLARFVSLQFRDSVAGDVLRGRTLREMHRVHWLEPSWQSGWGLGFGVRRAGERTLVGHGGALRGYRTLIEFSPEEKLGVVALMNADDAMPIEVSELAFRLVGPAMAKARQATQPARKADPAWQRYVGAYDSPWGESRVIVRGPDLIAFYPLQPDPSEGLVRLVPVEEHVFRAEGANGMGPVGELARFELAPDGRVLRLWIGDTYMQRCD